MTFRIFLTFLFFNDPTKKRESIISLVDISTTKRCLKSYLLMCLINKYYVLDIITRYLQMEIPTPSLQTVTRSPILVHKYYVGNEFQFIWSRNWVSPGYFRFRYLNIFISTGSRSFNGIYLHSLNPIFIRAYISDCDTVT